MKCKELLAALSDYVNGELDPETYRAFEEHLCGCTPCEVVVDNIRQTITVYRCGQPVELPSEVDHQLHRMLRRRWEALFGKGGGGEPEQGRK